MYLLVFYLYINLSEVTYQVLTEQASEDALSDVLGHSL